MIKRLIAFLFFLFVASKVWAAAPTFDAVSLGTANGSNTVTSSHTLGGGCTNSFAAVDVTWQHGSVGSVVTVTYGGTSLEFIVAQTLTDGERQIEKWGVKNPPTGAQTVTATLDASKNSLTLTTRTYCGVDQTTALGTPASAATFSAGPATVDVASATDDLVIDGVVVGGSADPITVGAGQTQRSNHAQDSTNHTQGTSDEAGAATTTMSWTLTVDDYWGIVAVALKPAAAGVTQQFAGQPITF